MTGERWELEEEILRFCEPEKTYLLLKTRAEIASYRSELPSGWSPFLVIPQSGHVDIYATEKNNDQSAVAVWADHSFVAQWNSIDEFSIWLNQQSRMSALLSKQ